MVNSARQLNKLVTGWPGHTTTVIAVFQVFSHWSCWCCAFRTGQCREQQAGKCSLVHDPTAVAVCPRWLQGSCSNAACLLQHCRCPDVMPVCTFYLQVTFYHTRKAARKGSYAPCSTAPSPSLFPPCPCPPGSPPVPLRSLPRMFFLILCSSLCMACTDGSPATSAHLSWRHSNVCTCGGTSNFNQGFWCVLAGLVHDRRLPLCSCQGGPKCTCMPGVCCWALPSWGSLHQEALDAPHDSPVATEQGIAGKQTSSTRERQACCRNHAA